MVSRKTAKTERNANWMRMLWWGPLLLGGIVTAAVVAARGPLRLRRAVRRLLAEPRPSDETRQLLRDAIVGNDKQLIIEIFGPPRTAVHRGRSGTRASPQQYLAADTWYYPFDRDERSAVVIDFRDDVARDVQFIRAPLKSTRASS
jgi:hypothetical protein